MKNHLVDSRRDFGKRKNLLDLFRREIADTNRFGESKSLTLLHSFPYCFQIHRGYALDWDRSSKFILDQLEWPMYKIQIYILKSQVLLETLLDGRYNKMSITRVTPQLGGDKYLRSGLYEARPESFCNSFPDRFLGFLHRCCVKVTVARLNGFNQS
ncbi:hypothetical protein HanPSC8_Chr08g0327231 [Helianthus annuus]|nr:hypothetical protein HanPSC8_Chr08g0327231 [Helianthus annuus]